LPPVACFSANGDFVSRHPGEGFLHAQLRNGNAASAGGTEPALESGIEKAEDRDRQQLDTGSLDDLRESGTTGWTKRLSP
jgi:hypothetical protein